MVFIGTAEAGTDALGEFAGRQQSIGLGNLALAVSPVRLIAPNLTHLLSVISPNSLIFGPGLVGGGLDWLPHRTD